MVEEIVRIIMEKNWCCASLVLLIFFQGVAARLANENWMSELPKSLLKTSLTEIAIPGSHDSASYSLNKMDDLAPEVPSELMQFLNISKDIPGGESFVKDTVYRWALTQRCNISQQLQLGIRYLDLRIIYRKDRGKIYTFHGLLGAPLEEILKQVKTFAETHQKELIVLDFNHMLHMSSEGIDELNLMLTKMLGKTLCTYNDSLKLTLENIWKIRKNVIVIYEDKSSTKPSFVWNNTKLVSPFKRDKFYNTATWLSYLDYGYKHRLKKNVFFVSQGILQPHWLGIATASLMQSGSLETWVSDDATSSLVSWLQTCKNGPDGINIVTADFVEKHHFIETVLEVNSQSTKISLEHRLLSSCAVAVILFVELL